MKSAAKLFYGLTVFLGFMGWRNWPGPRSSDDSDARWILPLH